MASPAALEGLRLERGDVGDPGGVLDGERVPGLVEQGGGQVLARREPLVELLGGADPLDDRAVERLAGLVVAGVVVEHLGPEHPHLVDLARELDEVAVHVRAGQLRVGDPREQAVQRVPELVEERRDLVEGQQRRLPLGRLRHVEVVDDDDRVVEQARLGDEGVHPGAAALRVAGVEVEHVQADRRPVLVGHLEDAGVRVVRRRGRGAP